MFPRILNCKFNTFKYLNFDLNVFIQGQFGNEILNFQRFELLNLNGQNNQSTEALNRWTPTIIQLGMWVFGLSRPLQLAWIIAIVVEHWSHSEAWQCIVQICFGVFFSCLQLYTLVIHRALLRKCLLAQREPAKDEVAPRSQGDNSKRGSLSLPMGSESGGDQTSLGQDSERSALPSNELLEFDC